MVKSNIPVLSQSVLPGRCNQFWHKTILIQFQQTQTRQAARSCSPILLSCRWALNTGLRRYGIRWWNVLRGDLPISVGIVESLFIQRWETNPYPQQRFISFPERDKELSTEHWLNADQTDSEFWQTEDPSINKKNPNRRPARGKRREKAEGRKEISWKPIR